MGGRGASSGRAGGADIRKMSDKQLEKINKSYNDAISKFDTKLKALYKLDDKTKWRQTREKRGKLIDEQRKISDEMSRRRVAKASNNTNKTFVNSFGEATKREITTASYKRQQKKLSNEIAKFIR